ncbi:hypothetical protein IR009_14110 [Pseudomonas putida]|uniref:hypothetical protein n=1 Tax=Pseudomonas putida TaxID=303 RepID=UPI0018AC880E|nr:hypothetical protein [Pseudomonas putida]MBF8766352.1 hypothetical protein [Pseudomonas putida]
MLKARDHYKLLINIGDSLAADKNVSTASATRAIASASTTHPDVVPAIRACQECPEFRWLVLDIIMEDFKEHEKHNPLAIFESIAMVFNALIALGEMSSLPPPKDFFEDYRILIEAQIDRSPTVAA